MQKHTDNGKEQLSPVPGFFVFEGIDGAGKTTLQKTVQSYLANKYPELLMAITKEPDGAPGFNFSWSIRNLVIGDHKCNPYTQALLMFAARYENCIHNIVPLLNDGHIVLCDRWTDSSYVYQGIAGGVDFDFIKVLSSRFSNIARTLTDNGSSVTGEMFSSYISKLMYPDMVFILDIEPSIAAERLQKRYVGAKTGMPSEGLDSLEQQYLSKMELMRYHYLGRKAASPDNYCVLDAKWHPDDLAQTVVEDYIIPYTRRVNEELSGEDN